MEISWLGCVYGLLLELEALTNRKLKAKSSGNVLYLDCVEKIHIVLLTTEVYDHFKTEICTDVFKMAIEDSDNHIPDA